MVSCSSAHAVRMLRLRPYQHPALSAAIPISCSWYYVKSYAEGSGIVRLPAGIV
jgi:hypothetical protein